MTLIEKKRRNRESARRWYYANKEKAKKRISRWQKEHPEKVKEYRKRNRAVILAGQRRCYRRRRGYYLSLSRAWAKANPDRRREIGRLWARNSVFKKLGFSIEKFNGALRTQKRKCAICLRKFSKQRRPNVDHCHKRGKVRGLLCTGCNLGLGAFCDSVFSLLRAIKYLRRAQ